MRDRPVPRQILLLTTDHQRYDCLGAVNPEIQTPVLDELIAGGALCERCYVQNPVCMPSRHSFMTGRYPTSLGVGTNGIALPERERTLAHALSDAGWFCGNYGKLHFLPHFGRDHTAPHPSYGFAEHQNSDEPGCYEDAYIRWVRATDPAMVAPCRVPLPGIEDRGWFRRWVFAAPEEFCHTAWVADRVIDAIRAHRNQPALLCGGFYAPHPPFNPPQRWLDRYDPAQLSLPRRRDGEADDKPPPLRAMLERAEPADDDTWRDCTAYFYAMCSLVDHHVGRIVAALDEEGLLADTLLVFMSDHGDTLGDHGLTGKHCSFYDSIMRVPLILHWPNGLGPGLRVTGLAEAVDLMPTLLEAAGAPVPFGVQGRSLWPLLDGGPGRDSVWASFFQSHRHPLNAQMVRTETAKYLRYGPHHGEVLYDLATDPDEFVNQAANPAYTALLAELRERLLRRMMDGLDPLPRPTAPY